MREATSAHEAFTLPAFTAWGAWRPARHRFIQGTVWYAW